VAFYDRLTASMDKGRFMDVNSPYFYKAFDTVPHNIVAAELETCRFDGWNSI